MAKRTTVTVEPDATESDAPQTPPPAISETPGPVPESAPEPTPPAPVAEVVELHEVVQPIEAHVAAHFGSVLIAETHNHRIVKIDDRGAVEVIAGTGEAGYSGDGGHAASAQLNSPRSIAVTKGGQIVFFDAGNAVVRKIDTAGNILTLHKL